MSYFKYGEKEIKHLQKQDPKLDQAISEIGKVKRAVNSDLFSNLISSIIGQQISVKAADTVKKRLKNKAGQITPSTINKLSSKEIQKCGMTSRKANYIKNIATLTQNKKINLEKLKELDNKDFIKEITKIKGVGNWTAEMLLIHSLERKDVLSYQDLGVRRGIKKLYSKEEVSKEFFQKLQKLYHPYGTIASIYLWEISKIEEKS